MPIQIKLLIAGILAIHVIRWCWQPSGALNETRIGSLLGVLSACYIIGTILLEKWQ